MESLEIAHKLLQLITRTLIQMITLKHKVSNPLLSLSCLFFSLLVYRLVRLCACKNAQSLCALCACVSTMGRRVVEGPEVCHTPENGQGQSSISDPSSSPSSFTLCCHGMSRWVTVSLATGCFLRSEGDAGRLVDGGGRGWGRGGCCSRWAEQPHELHKQGKQLSAITHHVSVFLVCVFLPPPRTPTHPCFLLINTRPWLKQQHEPNEAPFAYTCCVKSECEFTLTWSC